MACHHISANLFRPASCLMSTAAGAAFGGAVAASAISGAETARSALVRSANSVYDRWAGRRYTALQKQHLSEYKRFCIKHCNQTANLEFFEFNDTEECPVKGKDDLIAQSIPMDNADSPFNLCRERRALVRCIRRSCDIQWRSQENSPICSPETYVLSELRHWSRNLSAEPTQELLTALEGRERYVDEVHRYSQTHGKIPKITELLAVITKMLASCREKAKRYEWRQLLPRIHGEASAVCEGMEIILKSILCSAKPNSLMDSIPVNASALRLFQPLAVAMPEQDSALNLHQCLVPLLEEVKKTNEEVFAKYLLYSDCLPLTSMSHVDQNIVKILQEGFRTLKPKMQSLRDKLQLLREQCLMGYNSRSFAAGFRNWKTNYDEIRADIDETQVAIGNCMQNISNAESFMCQHTGGHVSSGSSRSRSLSSPGRHKRLKLD